MQHLRDFYLLVTVRREQVVQDAFDQIWQRRKSELLRPLRVRLGEMEGAEVGQDLGGVQIEFFNLVCKALFVEDTGKHRHRDSALHELTKYQACSPQMQSQVCLISDPVACSLSTCLSCSVFW